MLRPSWRLLRPGSHTRGPITRTGPSNALELAEENCRAAREAATAQTDVLAATIADATDELIPLVAAHIRATVTHYEAVVTEAKASEEAARSALTSAIGAMNLVVPHLATRYGLGNAWSISAVPAPAWPANANVSVESPAHPARVTRGASTRDAPPPAPPSTQRPAHETPA